MSTLDDLRKRGIPGVALVDENGSVTDGATAAGQSVVADNAAFTDGTTKVVPVGYILDESAGTALTENDVGAARMDSKRALVVVQEDATTRGQRQTINSLGQSLVNNEGQKATYSIGFTNAPAASATDVVTLNGSASKTIRVNRVALSGIATTAITTPLILIKRSTADTGGTSADQSANIAKHDSAAASPTATVTSYSANPTLGNGAGNIRKQELHFPLATAPGGQLVWDFGNRNGQTIVIRGTAEQLAVNVGGVTVSGGALMVEIEWTEE